MSSVMSSIREVGEAVEKITSAITSGQISPKAIMGICGMPRVFHQLGEGCKNGDLDYPDFKKLTARCTASDWPWSADPRPSVEEPVVQEEEPDQSEAQKVSEDHEVDQTEDEQPTQDDQSQNEAPQT